MSGTHCTFYVRVIQKNCGQGEIAENCGNMRKIADIATKVPEIAGKLSTFTLPKFTRKICGHFSKLTTCYILCMSGYLFFGEEMCMYYHIQNERLSGNGQMCSRKLLQNLKISAKSAEYMKKAPFWPKKNKISTPHTLQTQCS